MSSTARIDYSIRQNKSIERSVVFEGLRSLANVANYQAQPAYVGFGSVWFTDFHYAHRSLGVERMLSIELDEITAKRATYNKPYRTIEVICGDSYDVLPALIERSDLKDIPWIAWLDFDQALNQERLEQLDDLVRYMPPNSSLVTTFSATPGQYGKPVHRLDVLRDLLDFAIPRGMQPSDVKEPDDLARILAQSLEDRLVSISLSAGRPRAIPTFRLRYKDGTPMVTVGLFLPGSASASEVENLTQDKAWPGFIGEMINTPPLTVKEVGALRSLLPAIEANTRKDIQEAGFDLEEDQLTAFIRHYNRYPTFAQLAF